MAAAERLMFGSEVLLRMLILERIEVSPSQNKLIFSRDEPQK
jgi:hypothetical protein